MDQLVYEWDKCVEISVAIFYLNLYYSCGLVVWKRIGRTLIITLLANWAWNGLFRRSSNNFLIFWLLNYVSYWYLRGFFWDNAQWMSGYLTHFFACQKNVMLLLLAFKIKISWRVEICIIWYHKGEVGGLLRACENTFSLSQ